MNEDDQLKLPWALPLIVMHGNLDQHGKPLPPLELFQCPRCCALVQKSSREHHEGWHVRSVKEPMP